jgi:hypothetical protein
MFSSIQARANHALWKQQPEVRNSLAAFARNELFSVSVDRLGGEEASPPSISCYRLMP